MFVLKNLDQLQDRPAGLQERIFEKLFKQAETANLSPEEMKTYEESLKMYWDNFSVLKTARDEGVHAGMQKGNLKVASELKINGMSVDTIAK